MGIGGRRFPSMSSTSTDTSNPSRVGEFVYAESGRLIQDGYLAVSGTVIDGATLYPIWASKWSQYVVGSDIVFPSEFDGAFLRNIGGEAAVEGVFQDDATAPNGLSGTVLGAGDIGNNRRTGGSANAVRTGQNRTVSFSGDSETRPKNFSMQLYTIVDV